MNYDAIARYCCEKLSQQIRKIFEETEEKKAGQKEWQLKVEATRLKANKLRFHPIDSELNIREAQLNAQAIRTTTREIEEVIQCYRRENWGRDAMHKQLLREIVLERNKLIRLEVELELIKQRANKGTRTDNSIPMLMTEFATKYSKLKTCLNTLKLMMGRYEISLNDVISESSHAKLVVTELQSRIKERLHQEFRLNEQQRACAITLRVRSHTGRTGTRDYQKQTILESGKDVDEEIVKERLMSERETNQQLVLILNNARSCLLQEEHFKKEVETLQ